MGNRGLGRTGIPAPPNKYVLFVISVSSRDAITQAMEVTRITVDEVGERLNRGEQFTFVDTRNPQAWGESDQKLPGAIRVPADEVDQHLDEIPHDRTVITYCT